MTSTTTSTIAIGPVVVLDKPSATTRARSVLGRIALAVPRRHPDQSRLLAFGERDQPIAVPPGRDRAGTNVVEETTH